MSAPLLALQRFACVLAALHVSRERERERERLQSVRKHKTGHLHCNTDVCGCHGAARRTG
eukprot:8638547-Pyramimonas_sp.AAC.1